MHPLDAIELIAVAEPSKLGPLAGDLARLIAEPADEKTNGGVDPRTWAAVDAGRAFAAGELTARDLDRIVREATDVAREPAARKVDINVVPAAAKAAEVVRLLACGEPEEAAHVTRDVYGHTRRARVPEADVYDLFAAAISELEIFGDTETPTR